MKRTSAFALAVAALALSAGLAYPMALEITSGNTTLIFGGIDAEGGIGDWYLSNGVVEAIIDDVGDRPDLVGVVPPGDEPPIQSEINPTGGTLLDLGRVGENNDGLTQMLTVGGLSTSNFIFYDTISAPSVDTIRVSGKLVLPPLSVAPSLCMDVVTDYTAAGSDPFVTIVTTATNNCAGAATFGGFLDAFIWTQRSIVPFSAGATTIGGRGFNHPVLDLSSPAAAIELPTFMGGPGANRPEDGIVDTVNMTTAGQVSYGLVGMQVEKDDDGPGGAAPVVTPVNSLFGVSANLVSALGNTPLPGTLSVGGTITLTRRVYVGTRNDVRSVGDDMMALLAARVPFSTGTISGDVDAADTGNVEASIVVTRLGRCTGNPSVSCKAGTDCTGIGSCADASALPSCGALSCFSPGGAVSQIRTATDGTFGGVVLPVGDYELKVSSYERDDVLVTPVTVAASTDTPVVIPAMSDRGTVAFTVREKKAGMPFLPAKLVFKGVTPTADPQFHRDIAALLGSVDLQQETFGGTQAGTSGHAAGQGNVVYTATGQGNIQIQPGTYDVYASRGMEYQVQRRQITVAAGGSTPVDFTLKRSVRTKGAISIDSHIHSGRSLDTSAALRDRVAAFAGEGVEVMISTDHDKNVDYSLFIDDFGLQPRMTSIIGNELTGSVPAPPAFPNSYGHINAWPLTVSADDPRDGAIHDEFTAPNWIFKRLRDVGAEVIQYNHPRAGLSGITAIGYFNNIGCGRCANDIDTTCTVDTDCPAVPAPQDCTCVGYQPDRPIGMVPNDILQDDGVLGPGTTPNPDGFDNLDFDVMEIMNGAKDGDFNSYKVVRRDWLSLLNQGIIRPGTGVSDSHRITVEHAGWARTYVFGVGDDPATLDVGAMNDAVKAGATTMAAGPYVEFFVRTSGGRTDLGGLAPAPDGSVRLKIKVRSAAWVPVEEVRVVANGFVVASFDANTQPRVKPVPADFQSPGRTARFRASLNMNVTQDTYFLVEAGAKLTPAPTSPAIVDIIEPDIIPTTITNPIYVDQNGNSTFDPPGLPVEPLAFNTQAERPMFARVSVESEDTGLWTKLWLGLTQLASSFRGEAAAEKAPGEMTGITKEQKEEAVREGEYFPLREFQLTPEQVEEFIRQKQAETAPAAPTGGK
jgi:hypothetical protein